VSALAQQQQLLLAALFAWPPQNAMELIAGCAIDTGARGLKAYQTNGHMLAERVLSTAYPVVAQLVGAESMADLARALWHAHPPTRGDLALWGDALPGFLDGNVQLTDVPFLADVARAEWALHTSATLADAAADLASLALLTRHDPATLGIRLAPGCAVVQSCWPLASVLGVHLHQNPSMDALTRQFQAREAQDVLVWRNGWRPEFRAALADEPACISTLLGSGSLAAALDAGPALDFATWLPMAVHSGLILGVVPLPDPA